MNFRREAKIGGVPPGGSGGWFRPLFSFFNNIANLLRVSSCIKHSHDDRPVGLFDEIDHVIRPLKKRTSDVAVFFRKSIWIPSNPSHRFIVLYPNVLKPHRIAKRNSGASPRGGHVRLPAGKILAHSSRRAKPTHELRMRNRLAPASTIIGQTRVQYLFVTLRNRHPVLIYDRKPQHLGNFEPLALG